MIKINDTKHTRCDMKLVDRKALLKHVKITEDMDNGSVGIVNKGDFATGEREVYNLTKPTTALITAKVSKENMVIVSAPELIYQEALTTDNQLKNFYNEAGQVVRAYPLPTVVRFAVSAEGIDKVDGSTELAVGQFVVLQNGSFKMKASATAVDGATVGKIVRVDQEGIATYVDTNGNLVGNVYKMYVIEVL